MPPKILTMPQASDWKRALETGMQFIEQKPWIGLFRAQYLLGVDGISMLFIILTTFLTPICAICASTWIGWPTSPAGCGGTRITTSSPPKRAT